jgi:hypothetical protein
MYGPNSPSLTNLNVEEGGTVEWAMKNIDRSRHRENNFDILKFRLAG